MLSFLRPAGGERACTRVSTMLDSYLDGELSGRDKTLVDIHVASCKACAAALADARLTRDLLRALPVAPLPRTFFVPASLERKSMGVGFFVLSRAAIATAVLFVMSSAYGVVLGTQLPTRQVAVEKQSAPVAAVAPQPTLAPAATTVSATIQAAPTTAAKAQPPAPLAAAPPAAPAPTTRPQPESPRPAAAPIAPAAQSAPAAGAQQGPALAAADSVPAPGEASRATARPTVPAATTTTAPVVQSATPTATDAKSGLSSVVATPTAAPVVLEQRSPAEEPPPRDAASPGEDRSKAVVATPPADAVALARSASIGFGLLAVALGVASLGLWLRERPRRREDDRPYP
jgi:hypothetical protein